MNEERERLRAMYSGEPYLPPMGRLDEAILPIPRLSQLATGVSTGTEPPRQMVIHEPIGDPTDQLTRVYRM